MFRTLAVLLLAAIFAAYGAAVHAAAAPGANWRPIRAEETVSVQIVGGLARTEPSPLYTHATPKGREVIAKIVRWYNASPPAAAQPSYGRHGYPRVLRILLADGQALTVEPAYDCVSWAVPNGTQKHCMQTDGEIVFHVGSGMDRAKNRAFYDWLNGGWTKETDRPA